MFARPYAASRFLVVVAVLFFSTSAVAQVPDPVVTAQAPIPAVGHHYIGLRSTTGSPERGKLSRCLCWR